MPSDKRSWDGTRRAQDALERLYALWMISTLLLVLALVVIVFLLNARMGAHVSRVDEQNQRLAKLERIVLQLEARAVIPGGTIDTRDASRGSRFCKPPRYCPERESPAIAPGRHDDAANDKPCR